MINRAGAAITREPNQESLCRLYVRTFGAGKPLVLLHGFMGNGNEWSFLAPYVGNTRFCVCPDLVGHGQSPAPASPADGGIDRQVQDIVRVLDAHGLAAADFLGYSMGGRIALAFALRHPSRVSRLILESTSPGIEDQTEREARVRRDDDLSAIIETEGIAGFVETWERLPVFQSQHQLPEPLRFSIRQQRLSMSPQSASIVLRGMSPGKCPSHIPHLPDLTMPVLFVAGELDDSYARMAGEMADLVQNARSGIVPASGHNTHLEKPVPFASLVLSFLGDSNGPTSPS